MLLRHRHVALNTQSHNYNRTNTARPPPRRQERRSTTAIAYLTSLFAAHRPKSQAHMKKKTPTSSPPPSSPLAATPQPSHATTNRNSSAGAVASIQKHERCKRPPSSFPKLAGQGDIRAYASSFRGCNPRLGRPQASRRTGEGGREGGRLENKRDREKKEYAVASLIPPFSTSPSPPSLPPLPSVVWWSLVASFWQWQAMFSSPVGTARGL